MRIKKGDNVLIISGKDRGRLGKVIRSLPSELKVVVEGVNIRKKHVRARRQGEKGQMVHLPAPIPISNVKLVCPKCKKAGRVSYKLEGKSKFRICKRCGEII
ncbi:MAG: 50S ribosomal protein L24 [Candidatus Paceibacteria bacterium]